jgi:hypothetical protein
MNQKKEGFDQLAEVYGYTPVISKNPYMWSYVNEDGKRINHYFTTGTTTVQTVDWKARTYRNVLIEMDFEKVLIDNK